MFAASHWFSFSSCFWSFIRRCQMEPNKVWHSLTRFEFYPFIFIQSCYKIPQGYGFQDQFIVWLCPHATTQRLRFKITLLNYPLFFGGLFLFLFFVLFSFVYLFLFFCFVCTIIILAALINQYYSKNVSTGKTRGFVCKCVQISA